MQCVRNQTFVSLWFLLRWAACGRIPCVPPFWMRMRPYIWDAQTSMNFVCGSYFQYYLKKQSVFHLITLFAIYSAILLPSCIPLIICSWYRVCHPNSIPCLFAYAVIRLLYCLTTNDSNDSSSLLSLFLLVSMIIIACIWLGITTKSGMSQNGYFFAISHNSNLASCPMGDKCISSLYIVPK